jgi:DNA-binding PadR family transcriptional regulator
MNDNDERILLLLGLLSTQRQHGYQINEFIERNLARVSNMRKATAYALLSRLEDNGLVETTIEQIGNRPARRVYAITTAGETRLLAMLQSILAEPLITEPPGDIALMFIDHLDRATARQAIQQRLARLDREIEILAAAPPHEVGLGVDLALGRRLALLRADREWFAAASDRVWESLPDERAEDTAQGIDTA